MFGTPIFLDEQLCCLRDTRVRAPLHDRPLVSEDYVTALYTPTGDGVELPGLGDSRSLNASDGKPSSHEKAQNLDKTRQEIKDKAAALGDELVKIKDRALAIRERSARRVAESLAERRRDGVSRYFPSIDYLQRDIDDLQQDLKDASGWNECLQRQVGAIMFEDALAHYSEDTCPNDSLDEELTVKEMSQTFHERTLDLVNSTKHIAQLQERIHKARQQRNSRNEVHSQDVDELIRTVHELFAEVKEKEASIPCRDGHGDVICPLEEEDDRENSDDSTSQYRPGGTSEGAPEEDFEQELPSGDDDDDNDDDNNNDGTDDDNDDNKEDNKNEDNDNDDEDSDDDDDDDDDDEDTLEDPAIIFKLQMLKKYKKQQAALRAANGNEAINATPDRIRGQSPEQNSVAQVTPSPVPEARATVQASNRSFDRMARLTAQAANTLMSLTGRQDRRMRGERDLIQTPRDQLTTNGIANNGNGHGHGNDGDNRRNGGLASTTTATNGTDDSFVDPHFATRQNPRVVSRYEDRDDGMTGETRYHQN
ncbi:hypothetical protein E2P81_ATG06053 [Venturia nashicola]|nr:hypothetical protein E2P81_ATG06053 [Venturia nashicola]